MVAAGRVYATELSNETGNIDAAAMLAPRRFCAYFCASDRFLRCFDDFPMALLPIIVAPDPRLKVKAKPVIAVDDKIRRLMDDMLETMYLAPGIGLAAPQVGVARRVIVVDIAREGEDAKPLKLANPEILWRSEELATYNEGCLSLPEHYADVTRPAKIRLRYLDDQNEIREAEMEGLLATCVQHEMDHLEGTLFVDHISPLKRNIILRKLAKAKRMKTEAATA